MEKTKLGVSISLVASAMYLMATLTGAGNHYSIGAIPLFLLAGYVLLCEENSWLKWNAVKAVAFFLCFEFVLLVISLIPDLIDVIDSFLYYGTSSATGDYEDPSVASYGLRNFNHFFNVILPNIVTLCRVILGVVLTFNAKKMATVKVPVVDDLVQKNM